MFAVIGPSFWRGLLFQRPPLARTASSKWLVVPEPGYVLCLGTLAIPNSKASSIARELHLVAIELRAGSTQWVPPHRPLLPCIIALALRSYLS